MEIVRRFFMACFPLVSFAWNDESIPHGIEPCGDNPSFLRADFLTLYAGRYAPPYP